jgi:hypothetical protein
MRQCQYKDNVCFLIFSHNFFNGNNYDILYFIVLLFFTGFQGFLHKYLLYTSSDFFTEFFKIIFILYNVQMIKRKCYKIYSV